MNYFLYGLRNNPHLHTLLPFVRQVMLTDVLYFYSHTRSVKHTHTLSQ